MELSKCLVTTRIEVLKVSLSATGYFSLDFRYSDLSFLLTIALEAGSEGAPSSWPCFFLAFFLSCFS